jgi:putative flippase GtrA
MLHRRCRGAGPMNPGLARLMRFVGVGGIGFAVDAGVLTLLVEVAHVPLLSARLVSFTCASFVTWLLNRLLVFGDRRRSDTAAAYGNREEYLRYMAVQITGALTNLLVFFAVTWLAPSWALHVVVPLAIGSIVAAGVTYTLLNTWLFSVSAKASA